MSCWKVHKTLLYSFPWEWKLLRVGRCMGFCFIACSIMRGIIRGPFPAFCRKFRAFFPFDPKSGAFSCRGRGHKHTKSWAQKTCQKIVKSTNFWQAKPVTTMATKTTSFWRPKKSCRQKLVKSILVKWQENPWQIIKICQIDDPNYRSQTDKFWPVFDDPTTRKILCVVTTGI